MCTVRARCGSTFVHLFGIIWGSSILAAQCFTTATAILSPETLAILFGAWWCLLLGGLFVFKRRPTRFPRLPVLNSRRAVITVFALIALQAAVVIWELPDLGNALAVKQLAVVLRVAGIGLATKCPWWLEIFRGAYFVYIPILILLRRRRIVSRWTVATVLAVSATLSLSHMTRSPLLGASMALWASWLLIYRKTALRAWIAIGGVATVLILVFFLSESLIHPDNKSGFVENVQLFEPYFGGSMHGFETIMDGSFPRSPGLYSADMFYYTLNKLGLIDLDSFPSIVRPYGDNNSNVYTFLDAFTLDAGAFGALIGSMVIGLLGAILFNKASRNPSIVLVTAYSSFCYYISMSILNNEFTRINVVVTLALAAIVSQFVCERSRRRSREEALINRLIFARRRYLVPTS
jgi:oligosaccharide repeat unit polymerase